MEQRLFLLEPQFHGRVWGGQKLRAGGSPIGEAWVAHGHSVARTGPYAGHTVADLARRFPDEVLGEDVASRFGARFPLLIKLLDCADWLSVQVHPNDEQARRLVGPGHVGKTEAWHVLEVDEGATILAGVKPGTTRGGLARAIQEGRVLDVAQRHAVQAGETVFIPAGTLHALGPGLLLYEVQQASDTTYRVYDWDRPASAGRSLHLEESVDVTDPGQAPVITRLAEPTGTAAQVAVSCPFFELDVLYLREDPLLADTHEQTMHVLTAFEGSVEIISGRGVVRLRRYDTLLVAGSAGKYEVRALETTARVLRARLPAVVGWSSRDDLQVVQMGRKP